MLLWLLACRGAPQDLHPAPPPEALFSGPERAPVVVILHGLGDEPRSMISLAESCFLGRSGADSLPVRIVAPRGLSPYGDGYSWFQVDGIGTDLSYSEEELLRAADVLAKAIERWREPGKPLIVTGFSQGGMLSFALALRHPEGITAALPISGTFPEARLLESLPAKRPPAQGPVLRAFHGTSDTVVPFAPTRALVEELSSSGWDAQLWSAEGVDHTISPQMREAWCEELATRLSPTRSDP